MGKRQLSSRIFLGIGILLSHMMCIYVSYKWTSQLYGIEYQGYSAPAYGTLIYAVPFLIAIGISFFRAWKFRKK